MTLTLACNCMVARVLVALFLGVVLGVMVAAVRILRRCRARRAKAEKEVKG